MKKMTIRSRTTDGYQQVELTSALTGQSGATQQVISAVRCTKHLPFFLSIILADIFLFSSALTFAIYAKYHGDGFSLEQQPETPFRQFNLHALLMITAFIYLNGQAIIVYKSSYLIKHKVVNLIFHFLLHLMVIAAVTGGGYFAYNAQEAAQASKSRVNHFYSAHSWTGLITVGLFTIQFLFGFCTFFITLCCRKMTSRLRARALPVHRMLAMIVLCSSVSTVISGLTQLARFELDGANGRDDYREFRLSSILINVTAVCVIGATILVFIVTFMYKRRQAYDLPVMFKIILTVTQFVELILVLVVAESVVQVVTPHVNRIITGELFTNSSMTHFFNNATATFTSLITTVKSLSQPVIQANATNYTSTTTATPTIVLGSNFTV